MDLLKNKRAWRRWVRESGLAHQQGVSEPAEYPCYAYTTCLSFGYEELRENYLYKCKLESMVSELLVPVVKKKLVHKLPWYGSHKTVCATRMRCDTLREYDWEKVTCRKCLAINKERPGEY